MPELRFRHVDEMPWIEARAQMHGDRRVVARVKRLESAPNRAVVYSDYEPGMVIERHSHGSDHVVFVLEGSVTVGDVDCPSGTMILLEKGAFFGPLVGGPQGARMLEFYTGEIPGVLGDPEEFGRLLADRGIKRVVSDAERADLNPAENG